MVNAATVEAKDVPNVENSQREVGPRATERERQREEKGVSSTSPEPTLQSDTSLKGLEAGRSPEECLHREGIARLENRGHQLEILELKDWENSLLDFLPPSQVGISLEKTSELMQEGTATDHRWNFNVLAAPFSVFSESVKERKRLKPQDMDQNMELAQWNRSVIKWLNELALATPELTLTFEIPTKYDVIGIDTKNGKHHEELWKFANQINKLEVPSFNGEDPKTNEFLDRKKREAVAIYLDGEVVM
ncbi:Hypothetical predicted protein [Olea europaea subsp. europaea]|uniref:Uncharacterized protein n=1 Tax=Olea europaea subsp. europaea TaxID=158383 RepID=A0A8S0SL95_OLEEU|nr:Hypothetical predicted protein [Olea europaea subsp. europaea]